MTTQTGNLTTEAVAKRFYELAETGRYDVIQSELFNEDAVSIEPEDSTFRSVEGLDSIKEKAKVWQEKTVEIHDGYCSEPVVTENYFACKMGMDVTLKDEGRMKLDEIAVYKVEDGKIVSEQFFY